MLESEEAKAVRRVPRGASRRADAWAAGGKVAGSLASRKEDSAACSTWNVLQEAHLHGGGRRSRGSICLFHVEPWNRGSRRGSGRESLPGVFHVELPAAFRPGSGRGAVPTGILFHVERPPLPGGAEEARDGYLPHPPVFHVERLWTRGGLCFRPGTTQARHVSLLTACSTWNGSAWSGHLESHLSGGAEAGVGSSATGSFHVERDFSHPHMRPGRPMTRSRTANRCFSLPQFHVERLPPSLAPSWDESVSGASASGPMCRSAGSTWNADLRSPAPVRPDSSFRPFHVERHGLNPGAARVRVRRHPSGGTRLRAPASSTPSPRRLRGVSPAPVPRGTCPNFDPARPVSPLRRPVRGRAHVRRAG